MSARCRRPPESWCGYSSHASLRLRDADGVEQLDGAGARRPPRRATVDAQRLLDLAADREDRVERGHRLLEDEPDLGAADLLHLALAERHQVASVETDRAARRSGPGGCTRRMIDSAVTDLPLPDSPTRHSVSPGVDVKADVDHRRHEPPADVEAGRESIDA